MSAQRIGGTVLIGPIPLAMNGQDAAPGERRLPSARLIDE